MTLRAGVLLWLWPAMALGQTLDLPGNATLALDRTTAPDSYALPTGPWDGTLPVTVHEGAVTRQVWRIPAEDLTTLTLLAPLREQIEARGLALRLDCETEACGGYDFRFATEVLPRPEMFVDLGNFRFLSAEGAGEALSVLVSVTPREGFVQVIRVADDAAPPPAAARAPALSGPAPSAPDDFAARLEAEGRVVLTDLSFAPGSAQLAPDPYASLRALAAYLDANPGRLVALVGHTDAEGSLDGNIALSRRRAGSVLERLVERYGTRRAQLDAQGMGYLAPIATNLTPEGREANRRVEVILTSTE